ncbi:SRPBCC family protein [Blastococcus deserti]|uniref:Polyketide cyclase/dehydrase/lipid transport protein n=1 Tax=Blastococcus deserti TaxID=2259033 RepID=A0ABW4XFY1_9ACTN
MDPEKRVTPDAHPVQLQPGAARAHAGRGWLSGADPMQRPARVEQYSREVLLDQPPQEVFDFCLRAQNFAAIMPGRMQVLGLSSDVGRPGGTYAFRWWLRNVVPVRWVAYVDSFEEGRSFSDVQVRGVFRYFHHTHACEPADGGGTRYRDTIRFASVLGPRLDRTLVRAELDRTFRARHRRMRALLDAAA